MVFRIPHFQLRPLNLADLLGCNILKQLGDGQAMCQALPRRRKVDLVLKMGYR